MLTQSRRLIVPLFVYLSLLLATAVEAHDVPLHLRDHGNMKRLMKKRSPFPADDTIVSPPVVGAAGIPSLPATTTAAASTTSVSSAAESTTSATSTTSSVTSATTSTTASSTTESSATSTTASSTTSNTSTSTSTTSSSTTSSSAASSTTSAAAPPPVTSATLNIEQQQAPTTSTVTPDAVTQIKSVAAPTQTNETASAVSGAGDNTEAKSTTLTVIIAIAASVGGIAILWTVFRKWKLSSSKKFDERLRPIDWQQPTADDGAIPTHRRASLASSFRSGSGHGHSRDPLDHDFTAGASTIGGYADLSRGPSPLPPMQENITRGPSFNRGYEAGVPLHHQGYGGTRY